MPDIGELIRQEKLREQIETAQAEERASQEQALKQNPMTATDVARAMKPAALPTLGQVGGTLAGMATGPLAPVAVPALESLGGMVGEGANQLLGITQPSLTQIGIQGILPPVVRGATMAAKILPASTRGATLLNEIAPVEAKNQIAKIAAREPETASALFQKAEASKQRVPTLNTQSVIDSEVKNRLAGGSASDQYKGTREFLSTLQASLKRRQGALTPTQYQRELRDLGTMISKASTDVERGALTAVKRSLEDALEAAPAGTPLALARKVSLKENVLKDIDEFTFKADKTKQGQGDLTQFNASEVLRKIEKDESFAKRFKKAFTPTEQREIKKIYEKLNEFPPLPSAQGALSKLGSDIFQGARLGAVSSMVGASPSVAGAIGVAGTLTRPALETTKVFRQAMTTEEGRRVLLKELTANKEKPLREIMQRVAIGMSSTEPVQETVREEFGASSAIKPFPNQR